jgi:hypothetical protein
MLNEDCLNVRLGDYLNRRRDPPPDVAAEAADADGDARQDCAEDGEG